VSAGDAQRALEEAARAYAQVCARRPGTDICSGELGRIRERQLADIEADKRRALEKLGEAALAWAGKGR